MAVATAPADNDGEAALALEGLDDPRQLSTVAKQSPHDTVRTAALGRVHDVRALGSVARHAADPQTALEAVARIADHGELVNVALKTDHKDAGLSALERVASADPDGALRQTLETIATPREEQSRRQTGAGHGAVARSGRSGQACRARGLAAAGRQSFWLASRRARASRQGLARPSAWPKRRLTGAPSPQNPPTSSIRKSAADTVRCRTRRERRWRDTRRNWRQSARRKNSGCRFWRRQRHCALASRRYVAIWRNKKSLKHRQIGMLSKATRRIRS